MKKSNIILFLIISITGCNNTTSVSSGILQSSSSDSSIIEESSSSEEISLGYKLLNTNCDLNKINGKQGLTPSLNKANILVIPIHFSNIKTPISKDYLENAFNSKTNENLEWLSVKNFFYESSYGKLDMTFDILDVYNTNKTTSYYETLNNNYVDTSNTILIEALNYFKDSIDFSKYDANNDGYIDGVIMINDAKMDVNRTTDLWWAYTSYFNDETITFNDLKIKSNIFATRDFFTYDNAICDTHTIIHEITHMFGIDDYYDYNTSLGTSEGGLGWADLMDHDTKGDHNSFTKSLLNWASSPYLVTTNDSVTINLKPLISSGEYIILANDFNEENGLNQEYFILEYYYNTKANDIDKLFNVNGIRMLHIKADANKNGRFKYNNSTTMYKLISQITTSFGSTYLSNSAKANDNTLFTSGEKLNEAYYYNNTLLKYDFIINDLNNESANITITKKY